MTLEKLGESLTGVIKKITFAAIVDKKLLREVIKDLQRALLRADVNVSVVMELSKKIEGRALKEKPKAGVSKKEHIIRILYEELVSLLGTKQEFKIPTKNRIMLVGLQGSGKTTTSVKLAKFYMKKGLKPFLIAADTFRPAAYEQMSQLAGPLNIKVYGEPETKDPEKVVKNALKEAVKKDVIILDTAGRHKSQDELFKEMKDLSKVFKPDEKILVIDANIGQQAREQAKAFHEAIGVTGVILTKLDGSAKGGGALSAVAETASPIKFVGAGEGIGDFEVFDRERFISRLLGMGDLASLMEKAKENIEEEKVKDILKGDFTLNDLYSQIEAIRKMGSLSSVIKMIPGLGGMMPKEDTQMTEEKMKKFLVIMDSMTEEERKNTKIINSSRIKRISKGSGTLSEDIKELMNYYNVMKRALKGLKKGRFARGPLAKMMRGFKG